MDSYFVEETIGEDGTSTTKEFRFPSDFEEDDLSFKYGFVSDTFVNFYPKKASATQCLKVNYTIVRPSEKEEGEKKYYEIAENQAPLIEDLEVQLIVPIG